MTDCTWDRPKRIETIAELHSHLQTAIQLEHATIPAYLTALYSIKEGSNPEASMAIRGVVIEEMLHLTLAANILNAVGGAPSINSKAFVPTYPTELPNSVSPVVINLQRFSEKTIDMFMEVEQPAAPEAPPESDNYETIGQFYEAIEDALEYLVDKYDVDTVFSGQLSRQVQPHHYYGSGGSIHVVQCPETAKRAIQEIIDQGEGARFTVWEDEPAAPDAKRQPSVYESPINVHPAKPRKVAAHYYRFEQIKMRQYYRKGDKPGRPTGQPLVVDYDAVWPIGTNTYAHQFEPGSDIRRALDDFNRCYMAFLDVLHRAFNGQPELVSSSVPMMYDLKYKAQSLMKVPNPNGEGNIAPTWEWVAD